MLSLNFHLTALFFSNDQKKYMDIFSFISTFHESRTLCSFPKLRKLLDSRGLKTFPKLRRLFDIKSPKTFTRLRKVLDKKGLNTY